MKNPEYISRKLMDRYNDKWIRKMERVNSRIMRLEQDLLKMSFLLEGKVGEVTLAKEDPAPPEPTDLVQLPDGRWRKKGKEEL